MGTWARTGPVVVEVDGSAEGLRVVDYTVLEAMRSGAELVFAAPFHAHSSYSPMMPAYLPKPPSELADDGLRAAIAHVHQRYGYGLALTAVSKEGSRLKALPRVARHARLLVLGRNRVRGAQRLVGAQGNIFLSARSGCPVVVVPMTWKASAIDRRIAVGIDGTPLSTEAVEFAFRTAADREGDLTVVRPRHAPQHDRNVEESWVSRPDVTVAETLAGWTDEYPRSR